MSTTSSSAAAASAGAGMSSDGRMLHNQTTASSSPTSNAVDFGDAVNTSLTSSRSEPTSPLSSLYLNPDYVQPLSTCLDSKNSPLALLAQTCSSIGRDPASTSAATSSAAVMVTHTMTSSSAISTSVTSRIRAKCITSSVGLTPATNGKTGKNYNERKVTAENAVVAHSQSQMTQHKQVSLAKTKPPTGNNMVPAIFGENSSSSTTVFSSSLAPKGSEKSTAQAISSSTSNSSTAVTVTSSHETKLQNNFSDQLNNNLFPVSVPSSMLDKFQSTSANSTAACSALFQDVYAMQTLHSAMYGAPLNSAAAAAIMFANSFPYRSDIVAAAAAAAAGGAHHPGPTGDSPTCPYPLDSVTNANIPCLIPGYDCRGNAAAIDRMMNAAAGRFPPDLMTALSRNHGVLPGLGVPIMPTQNGVPGVAPSYQCSWFQTINGEFCRKQYNNFSELAEHLRSHVNEALDPLPPGPRSKTGSTSPNDKYLTQQKSPLAALSDSPGSAAHAYRQTSSLQQHPLTVLPLLPPPLPAELGIRFREPTMDYHVSRYPHLLKPNQFLTDPTNSISLFHQLNLAASSSSSPKSRPFLGPSYRYHPYHRASELPSSVSSVLSSTSVDDGLLASHFSGLDSLQSSLLSAYMTSPFGLPAISGSQRFGSSAAAVPL